MVEDEAEELVDCAAWQSRWGLFGAFLRPVQFAVGQETLSMECSLT